LTGWRRRPPARLWSSTDGSPCRTRDIFGAAGYRPQVHRRHRPRSVAARRLDREEHEHAVALFDHFDLDDWRAALDDQRSGRTLLVLVAGEIDELVAADDRPERAIWPLASG
jgi:hypothetical protein